MKYWLQDRLLPAGEACVQVDDRGFTGGLGVFETLRAAPAPGGRIAPFAVDSHLDRLAESARRLGLPEPPRPTVRSALESVCDANRHELGALARVRVTWTAGQGAWGSRSFESPTLVVTASRATGWVDPAMLALAPHPRNELGPLRGVKCTSNAENALAAAHAAQLGADDSILLNLAGSVCETASANIFWVRAGLLRTPSLQTGCLAGVTRDLLIRWARDSGWDVHETAEPVAALTTADEVFITSSLRQVQPVSHVLDAAGRPIWRRAGEGAAVAAISELFAARSNADWNPRRAAQ